MNFQLTKEQEFVRKLVRDFAVNEVEPLAADIDKEHRFPVETVEKMAKYGLMGVPFPTQYGGAGGDHISYAITVEELSRVCASTGVICSAHTSLCAWPIFNYGTDEQKAKYLPDLCSGRKLGAFGLTEPGAGTDAAGQQTNRIPIVNMERSCGDYPNIHWHHPSPIRKNSLSKVFLSHQAAS